VINKIVKQAFYIDLYNSYIGYAPSVINDFQILDRFISSYKEQQTRLATLFANYGAFYEERNRVVKLVYNEFLKIKP
jgi:hypothetical protein